MQSFYQTLTCSKLGPVQSQLVLISVKVGQIMGSSEFDSRWTPQSIKKTMKIVSKYIPELGSYMDTVWYNLCELSGQIWLNNKNICTNYAIEIIFLFIFIFIFNPPSLDSEGSDSTVTVYLTLQGLTPSYF